MSETSATPLIDYLPGQRMRVAEVMRELAKMWSAPPLPGQRPPQDFRASQLNLILHMGLQTTPEEARTLFDIALTFGQEHPCRIIVLCPMGQERSEALLEAKLFAQCYLGQDLRHRCCVEALILGYPTREAGFLSSQISTWVEGDLPIYHWVHRVPLERLHEYHFDFLQSCRRVLFDSAIERECLTTLPWKDPRRIADLAHARLLPIRQSLGQFLSSFAPAKLVDGLQSVVIHHDEAHRAEAKSLARWARARLEACASLAGQAREFAPEFDPCPSNGQHCLEMTWHFAEATRQLHWQLDGPGQATVEARLNGEVQRAPLPAAMLSPAQALSEALFFA